MNIVFSTLIRAENNFVIFQVYISKNGEMTGRKIFVDERDIDGIKPEELSPVEIARKHFKEIHRLLRDKIENGDYQEIADRALVVRLGV